MARQQRIQFPGASYHVMARGNAGGDMFGDDEDRGMFLDLLGDIATKAGWRVHAWCLMDNHFHLHLTTPQPNLAVFMQRLNSTYCQRFNRRHSRQGHVVQGRYKALLVGEEAYALQLLRYILNNPKEAGLVYHIADYPWSSAQDFLSKNAESWMDFGLLNHQLDATSGYLRDALADFVSQDHCAPTALRGQIYGDQSSIERLAKRAALPDDLTRPPISSYCDDNSPNWHIMARAVIEGKHRGADVARYFDVHRSTVTKAVARLEKETNEASPMGHC